MDPSLMESCIRNYENSFGVIRLNIQIYYGVDEHV